MKLNGKTMYAQSSDIKSRTYLEYKKDMKKKAIAELEILDWLKPKLATLYPSQKIEVSKSGGDAFLWFLRKGGVSRAPDYKVKVNSNDFDIEFQYADKSDLKYFDFAVSKIAKKNRKTKMREPHQKRKILYVLKSNYSFAFFDPEWVFKKGKIGFVDAWRKDAYRVPKNTFLKILRQDPTLKPVIEMIDIKNDVLNFQHELIGIIKDKLSYLLQQVIDEKTIVTIMPDDLNSFFQVCFILDSINKIPKNASLWLIYLLSYIRKDLTLERSSKIVYCIDFLYSKIELKPNELTQIVDNIEKLMEIIKGYYQKDGSYKSSLKISPLEETRYALSSINLLEDLIQDMIFYYSVKKIKPIKKIYENVENIEKTYKLIKSEIKNE